MRNIVVLGPQRLLPTVGEVVAELAIEGQVAAVTAGWREREAEDDELARHLGRQSVNLGLYRRAEELFAEDAPLQQLFERRRTLLREAQAIYRVRLDFLLAAARTLMKRNGGTYDSAETEAAIEDVRRLDRQHLERVEAIHTEFAEAASLRDRPSMKRHREEVGAHLDDCDALAITGGHVAVVINRLRLFDIAELLGVDKPIIAWSAGAMALAPQIVLYHDFPPQGAGNAEVLEPGLGLYPRVLPLPHARRRLDIADPVRVGLLARRFEPLACVAMDEGSRLVWNGEAWATQRQVRLLAAEGEAIDLARETAGEAS